jgi:hypothetical protein
MMYLGDVDHIHTGLERQVTTVDLEVLKDPKVEIKVLNLTHNNIDQVSQQFYSHYEKCYRFHRNSWTIKKVLHSHNSIK